ncbi:MAG: hypothetical protein ACNA8W_16055 [Bradymonadaceae bacterium]
MQKWPVNIRLEANADLTIGLFGKPLYIRRLQGSTLSCSLDVPTSERLVGIHESADTLQFVPELGERALLIFPRPTLLCPALLKLTVYIELPLFLQMSVGKGAHFDLIDGYTPPTVAKGIYGPVDAGIVCTSMKGRCAPSIETLTQRRLEEEDGHRSELSYEIDDGETRRETLVAYCRLEVVNTTDAPLEITKIMLPANQLSLYQNGDQLLTNHVRMRLLSKQEAELSMLGAPDPPAKILQSGTRSPSTLDKGVQIFSFAYRSKTGLDYGF